MLTRELFPELDDQQFRRLVSDIGRLDPRVTPVNSFSIIRPPTPVSGTLGSVSEPIMFHALLIQLVECERPAILGFVASVTYIRESQAVMLVNQLLEELTERLANFYIRPLVAHIKKISASNQLRGDSAEERYEDYCRRWHEDFIDDFHLAYPVLRRVHGTITSHFCAAIEEFFERLRIHEDDIRLLLGGDTRPLEIKSLRFAGDHHHGGRATCLIFFIQGTVVYKPRTVDGEWAFDRIIKSLGSSGIPSIQTAAVIRGHGYGFMEFIESEDVDFHAQDFLESAGQLAGLFYALQGNDMHTENLVPRKQGPVPIDLETLLHPVQIISDEFSDAADNNAFIHKARGIAAGGLLPTRLRRSDPSQGYIDVGFIQGKQGTNPFSGMTVEQSFRDDASVRFIREFRPDCDSGDADQPATTEAQRRSEAKRAEAFSRGFSRMYRWICDHRDLFETILRVECTGIELRVVLQPTMRYGQLLRMLGSPEALAHEEMFATVALRTSVLGHNRPVELVLAEAEALRQLDIPYFVQSTDRTQIVSSEGQEVGLEVKESALQETLRYLTDLGEDDLEEQLNQIWSAFVSPYPANSLAIVPSTLWNGRGSTREERDLCTRVADLLVAGVRPGVSDDAPWTWVAPVPGTQHHTGAWATDVLGLDLYAGSIGPALALAQTAQALGMEQYAEVARRILDPLARSILSGAQVPGLPENAQDSALFGEPGVAFALAGAAESLQDERLGAAALELGNHVAARLARSEQPSPDYLTGHVGAAAMLLGHDLVTDRSELLGVLDRHARDVLAGDIDDAWWSQSGFAHGVSASIFALARWNCEISSSEHAVERLLNHLENFRNEEGWESQVAGTGSRGGVWCHGSAGIALALGAVRTWMPNLLADGRNLDRAVHHAMFKGTGRNLTYCHGDLGTLDALEWIVSHDNDLPIKGTVQAAINHGYGATILRKSLGDKSVRYSSTPSLMVGTSGVLSWLIRRLANTRLRTPLIPDSSKVNNE